MNITSIVKCVSALKEVKLQHPDKLEESSTCQGCCVVPGSCKTTLRGSHDVHDSMLFFSMQYTWRFSLHAPNISTVLPGALQEEHPPSNIKISKM
jgi:hypothetical protein